MRIFGTPTAIIQVILPVLRLSALRNWRRRRSRRRRDGPRDDGRPHGFDVVEAIAGPQNWGVDGDADTVIAYITVHT
jgi:hypothetical protein